MTTSNTVFKLVDGKVEVGSQTVDFLNIGIKGGLLKAFVLPLFSGNVTLVEIYPPNSGYSRYRQIIMMLEGDAVFLESLFLRLEPSSATKVYYELLRRFSNRLKFNGGKVITGSVDELEAILK